MASIEFSFKRSVRKLIMISFFGSLLSGCTFGVKPITINLNVKIDHEIRVKVDKDLDDLFESESELFE